MNDMGKITDEMAYRAKLWAASNSATPEDCPYEILAKAVIRIVTPQMSNENPADLLADEAMDELKIAEHYRVVIRLFAGWLIKRGWKAP